VATHAYFFLINQHRVLMEEEEEIVENFAKLNIGWLNITCELVVVDPALVEPHHDTEVEAYNVFDAGTDPSYDWEVYDVIRMLPRDPDTRGTHNINWLYISGFPCI
jgi:hypothetical protein